MRHSVQCHGAQFLLGLFSQRTLDTQVDQTKYKYPRKIILTHSSCFISAVISEILSCRLFLVTTRLAYAVYLTQFPIFFYNVGTTRHSGYYHVITTTVGFIS